MQISKIIKIIWELWNDLIHLDFPRKWTLKDYPWTWVQIWTCVQMAWTWVQMRRGEGRGGGHRARVIRGANTVLPQGNRWKSVQQKFHSRPHIWAGCCAMGSQGPSSVKEQSSDPNEIPRTRPPSSSPPSLPPCPCGISTASETQEMFHRYPDSKKCSTAIPIASQCFSAIPIATSLKCFTAIPIGARAGIPHGPLRAPPPPFLLQSG